MIERERPQMSVSPHVHTTDKDIETTGRWILEIKKQQKMIVVRFEMFMDARAAGSRLFDEGIFTAPLNHILKDLHKLSLVSLDVPIWIRDFHQASR